MDINKQQKLDLTNSTPYLCDECSHDTFVTAFKLRSVSAMISPTGEFMIVPLQVFMCKSCNHVNEEFLPNGDGITLA